MVAVVTGSGVGLVNSSKDVLGSAGELGNASTGRTGERVTVNAANGNLVVQDRDEYLVGVGPDVDLLRTYNSQGAWDGDNNDNWRIGYYRRVSGSNGAATISRIEADGHTAIYTNTAPGLYTSTEGAGQYDTLRWNGSGWTWTDGDSGVTETYALESGSNYRLTQVTDPEGHRVQLTYTLSVITQLATFKYGSATADETVTLSYSGTQLKSVSTAYKGSDGTNKTRSLTSYTYDGSGRLKTVTTDLTPDDASDNATQPDTLYSVTYSYDANGRLSNILQKDGNSQTIEYYADGRVKSIKDDQNHVTGFTYSGSTTTVTDALQQATTLKFDASNQLVEIAGAAMGGTAYKQSYSYDSSGNLLTSTNGANQTTTYDYTNGNGAWTRRTDAAGSVTERSYDPATHLLTAETVFTVADPDGPAAPGQASGARRTQYLYDTTSGHRRLRYLLGPQGQVTRFEYTSQGQIQRQTQYTSAWFSGSATLSNLESWATGPQANTLARQVVDYTYDLRGQVREEMHYATESAGAMLPDPTPGDPSPGPASLPGADGIAFGAPQKDGSSLPEATGAVVTPPTPLPVVEGGLFETAYVYDAFGRLLSQKNQDGFGVTYLYDGLNRITQSLDAVGTTLYTYDDAGRKTSIKLANGQTTVQLFDSLGNLISSDVMGVGNTPAAPKLLGATQYTYDALSRLRRVTDATGVSSYFLYDVSGRKSADIAANGQLTEYVHDAAGRLIQSVAYATLVTPAQLAALTDTSTVASLRPAANSATDRVTTYYYDAAGRLTGTLDADGYLTENQYDGTFALVRQTRYASVQSWVRVDVTKGSTQTSGPAWGVITLDAINDRTTRKLYDASGQLAAQIDGEGALTLYTYDAAGNLLSQLRRSQLLSDAQRTGASLSELQALAPLADDEFTQWVYDNAGRQMAQLDAEGFLTETLYDSVGRLSGTVRYLKQAQRPIQGSPAALQPFTRTQLTDALRNSLSLPTAPLKTSKTYNSRGLLESETAVDGTVTFYTYDELQRLKTTTLAKGAKDADGNSIERSQSYTYDDWGRLQFTQTQGDATGITITYDAAGRKTSVQDARGNTTYFYYDAQGRQVYAILVNPATLDGLNNSDKGGEVTETLYSSFSEVQSSVTHKNRLSVADTALLKGGLADSTLIAKVNLLTDATDNKTSLTYNRRGLIQQAIDALGAKTDTRYNAFGQVATLTRDVDLGATPRSVTTTETYDRRGLLTQEGRTGGTLSATTQTKYDALGRLSKRIDELLQETTSLYTRNTGSGRQITVTGPAGSVTTTYDALDRVLTRKDRNSNTVTYGYDDVNRKFTVTTGENIQTTTELNRFGQTVKVTDGTNATTTYAYDVHGDLVSVTDALGNVTQNTYDANHNLTQVIQGLKSNGAAAPSNDGSAVTTRTTYDAANRVLTQTVDPSGLALKTQYEYDGQGRRLKITDPRGTVTTQTFTARGDLQDVIVDAGGLNLKTSYSVDAQGRTLSVTEGAGTSAARKTTYQFDELGRKTAEILDPDGIKLKTTYEYDAAGQLKLQRNSLGQVTARYVYDGAGRLSVAIDATGAVLKNSYDGEGHLTARLGYATRLAAGWDSLNDASLAAALTALGTAATDQQALYTYDKDGRQTFAINGAGEATQFLYDKAGRVVETVRFAKRLSGYTSASDFKALTQAIASAADLHSYTLYDTLGRVQYSADASGLMTAYSYDRNGHVTRQTQYATRFVMPIAGVTDVQARIAAVGFTGSPDRAQDRVTDFTYDAAGRQRFLLDAEGYVSETRYDDQAGTTTTLRYDQRWGGAASYTPAATPVTTASFTPAQMALLGGSVSVTRGLDRAGRVSTVTDGNGVTTLTTYDEAGRVKTEVFASGRPEQSTTLYKYNSAGQLTDKIQASGTAVASTTRYDYDSVGRLWHTIDPRGVALAEGTSAWEQGERVRRGYPADLSTLSGAALDAAKAALLGAFSTETQYDAAGRVSKVIDPLGGVTLTQYDAFGNAVQRTDARGYASYQVFDRSGRLVQSIDAERYLTAYDYDAFGNLKTTLRVDARVQGSLSAGQAVQVLSSAPASGPYVLTNAALDHLSSNTYDRANRLLNQTDAESYLEGSADALTGLSAFGQRLSTLNKLGATTTYTYDRLGRVLTETLPVTAKDAQGALKPVVNAYQYDSRGNRIQSTEAQGLPEQRVTQMRYDGAGRLVLSIGTAYTPDGAATAITPADWNRYDGLGNLIEHIEHGQLQPDGVSVTGGMRSVAYYDALSRKTLEIAPDRAATATAYDPAGHVVVQTRYANRIADAVTINATGAPLVLSPDVVNDRTLRTRYDALGRKIETALDWLYTWEFGQPTDPLNPQTTVLQRLYYDAVGNLTERQDGRGNSSFSYYDGLGRQLLTVDAGGATTAWEYARADRVATRQTRYAGMLFGGYLRQANTLAQVGNANDPAQIAALAAAQPLQTGDQHRITVYTLDRLGRVTEQRIKDVAQDTVDYAGTRTQSTADAVTQYQYNGLGAVTQVKELAAQIAAAQTWEQTDIVYDKLGREIDRQAPQFQDYQGALVRPTTDTEYDGLGRVSRRIQRGKNNAVETDDHITLYTYDKGLLTQVTDATGAVTRIGYDNLGHLARRTSVGVHRSDVSARDLVKTFQSDAAGRVTVETDLDTGEVRKTRYNAFGEIAAKGLGDGWEEFAEYSTLGKVQKTNSGDGAIKFYLYDANGNQTREMRGNGDDTSANKVDLKALTLAQASASKAVYGRVSVYDKRNLLTKTIDPQIDVLKNTVSLSSLYQEEWVPAWTPPVTGVQNATLIPAATVSGVGTSALKFSFQGTNTLGLKVDNVPWQEADPMANFDGYTYYLTGPGSFSRDVSKFKGTTHTFSYDVDNSNDGTLGASMPNGPAGKGGGQFTVDANGVITNVQSGISGDRRPGYVLFNWDGSGSNPPSSTPYHLWITVSGQAEVDLGEQSASSSSPARVKVSDYRPEGSGSKSFTIRYTKGGLNPGAGSFSYTINSDGVITKTGSNSDPGALPMVFAFKGRQIAKVALKIGAIASATVPGDYFPATGSTPSYTLFGYDARGIANSPGTYSYSLTAQDANGNTLYDELGRPLIQKGRVILNQNGDYKLEQQVTVLNTSDKVVITRTQAWNAFGEVSDEHDERVAERMKVQLGFKATDPNSVLTAAQLAAATTTLRYNVLGELVAKLDPETWITAANGYRYRDRPVTQYGYDLLGRHTTTLDANGNLSRVSYDAGSRASDASGSADVANEFDAMGGTGASFDTSYNGKSGKGGIKQTQHDIFGNARRVIDAELHVSELDYDARDRLVTVTRKNVVRYDGAGTKLAAVDLVDQYAYDELGQRIKATNALLDTTSTDYDGLGRVVKTSSAQGAVTRYAYEQHVASDGGITAIAGAVSGAFSGGVKKTTTRADGRTLVDKVDYFGHTVSHTDLSGMVVSYSFNSAGQLVQQTSTAHAGQSSGQNIQYGYYANGYIQSLKDLSLGTSGEYAYDNAGNRTYEAYFKLDPVNKDAQGAPLKLESYQNSTITYDELNRIVRVQDTPNPLDLTVPGRFDIRYEYDAMSNRRLVDSVYWDGAAGLRDRQTYWYAYDAMNRFVVTKGQLSSTAAATGNPDVDRNRFANAPRAASLGDTSIKVVAGNLDGVAIGYDRNSQRVSATYTYNNQTVAETYAYSDDGYLQLTSQSGALKTSRELDKLGRTVWLHDKANLQDTGSTYDKDHRLLSQTLVDGNNPGSGYTLSYAYYTSKADDPAAATASGFGALARTSLSPNEGVKVTTTYRYDYWDDAHQVDIRKTSSGYEAVQTQLVYDTNGHLASKNDVAGGSVVDSYITTASGLILQRVHNGAPKASTHFFYYADDNRVGDVSDTPDDVYRVSYAEQLTAKATGNKRSYYRATPGVGTGSASTADFDQNYEPINDNYPGSAGSNYSVRSNGETLSSIAKLLWGDASMWYLIAESNGLRIDAALKAGQILKIPNKVTNIHNTAWTWRPYNPGEAIGRVEPDQPWRARPYEYQTGASHTGKPNDFGDWNPSSAQLNDWTGAINAGITAVFSQFAEVGSVFADAGVDPVLFGGLAFGGDAIPSSGNHPVAGQLPRYDMRDIHPPKSDSDVYPHIDGRALGSPATQLALSAYLGAVDNDSSNRNSGGKDWNSAAQTGWYSFGGLGVDWGKAPDQSAAEWGRLTGDYRSVAGAALGYNNPGVNWGQVVSQTAVEYRDVAQAALGLDNRSLLNQVEMAADPGRFSSGGVDFAGGYWNASRQAAQAQLDAWLGSIGGTSAPAVQLQSPGLSLGPLPDYSAPILGGDWGADNRLWIGGQTGTQIVGVGGVAQLGELRPLLGPALYKGELPAGGSYTAYLDQMGQRFYDVTDPGAGKTLRVAEPDGSSVNTLDRVVISGKRDPGLAEFERLKSEARNNPLVLNDRLVELARRYDPTNASVRVTGKEATLGFGAEVLLGTAGALFGAQALRGAQWLAAANGVKLGAQASAVIAGVSADAGYQGLGMGAYKVTGGAYGRRSASGTELLASAVLPVVLGGPHAIRDFGAELKPVGNWFGSGIDSALDSYLNRMGLQLNIVPPGPKGVVPPVSNPALTFRPDFDAHLVSDPNPWSGNKLNGTHNMYSAIDAAALKPGATFTMTPTGELGIYEMRISIPKPDGQIKLVNKTVYDPAVFSDTQMINMARQAGADGWAQYARDGYLPKPPNGTPAPVYEVQNSGVTFKVYINYDGSNIPFVGNAHPIKPTNGKP